jgi:hypothetical protein
MRSRMTLAAVFAGALIAGAVTAMPAPADPRIRRIRSRPGLSEGHAARWGTVGSGSVRSGRGACR